MIEGVVTKQLKQIADERGWLIEVLRNDWEHFQKFGQAYLTAAYPQVVKAWHKHKKQTDNITCIKGMIKLVLYDGRKKSKTKNEINELTIGEKNLLLVKIPPEVWHGFKTITEEYALVLNVPTELYNYKEPDEHRLPPDTDKIPYDWKLTPWLKHG
ncbi:MAG: dTDP-4-dehydrorhamnose 3,5-epimerase family protein [Candidatus Bathyarchaeota archaeon]|nr:dTDP-4-dehydrorhamnose 3,5-epimerase family protein [Candidatus Bathyarchaeota archaeon]MDH5788376.1 dTDP-4-dehydrorhamnose 3,5-epimerase family protein [Candidatus Bathyarchaeota archaeon]